MFLRSIWATFLVIFTIGLAVTGCELEADINLGDPVDIDTETETEPDTSVDDEQSVDDEFAFSDNLQEQECPDHYEVVAIPTLGGERALARSMNNLGWVVGLSEYETTSWAVKPFIWKPFENNGSTGETIFFDEEGLANGEDFSPNIIYDVNDHGELVGTGMYPHPSGFGGTMARSFYWSEEDGLQMLPGSQIAAINNDGIVLGVAHVDEGEDRYTSGYYWTMEDGATYLPRIPGAYDWAGSDVYDINEAGVITGMVDDYYFRGHAMKYTPETSYSKLPDYGTWGLTGSQGLGINNLGQIVGSALKYYPAVGGTYSRPILWEANGEMHDLGILSANSSLYAGEAVDINDAGLVVGADFASGGGVPSYAWVWCGGVKRALNDVVQDGGDWHFSWVAGINNAGPNNAGQIAVNGSNSEYPGQSALLIPVFDGGVPAE